MDKVTRPSCCENAVPPGTQRSGRLRPHGNAANSPGGGLQTGTADRRAAKPHAAARAEARGRLGTPTSGRHSGPQGRGRFLAVRLYGAQARGPQRCERYLPLQFTDHPKRWDSRRERATSELGVLPAARLRRAVPTGGRRSLACASLCMVAYRPTLAHPGNCIRRPLGIAAPGARMVLVVHPPQALFGDVGVDLGGGDRGVTQHLLQAPQVGPALEQVGRKRVPQHVR